MSIGILGTGAWLPPRICRNADLERFLDTTDEWIVSRTGIRERRLAGPEITTSDAAAAAARAALADAGAADEQVGGIVLATSSPDRPLPATACIVQHKLGLSEIAAFDVSAVCTGFVYSLAVGAALLETKMVEGVGLVIGAETYSRILDWSDRKTSVFFGDGAGAAVLGPVPDGYGLLSTALRADGRHHALVHIPAGGAERPVSGSTLARREHLFQMDGPGVWDYATSAVPDVVTRALKRAGLGTEDVDLFVFHQANAVMLRTVLDHLDVGPDRAHFTVERYGNTAAASVPITLHEARQAGRIGRGSLVVLAAVGGGMTAGAAVLRWW